MDAASERNDAGGDNGEPLKLDLPGVQVTGEGNQIQAAAEIVADLRSRVGIPRVRWVFSIRADMLGATGLGLGDVVTVTSSYAVGIVPSTPVVNVPCRIVGRKRDQWKNTLELEVRPFPGVTAGWAPSALVTATPSGASVSVSAATYSDNGTDASWFTAGDKVCCFSPGAWSARTNLTILSVVGNLITFTANHLGAAGDIIRTDDYVTAVTNQEGFAFLADADGELGPGDPGFILG